METREQYDPERGRHREENTCVTDLLRIFHNLQWSRVENGTRDWPPPNIYLRFVSFFGKVSQNIAPPHVTRC